MPRKCSICEHEKVEEINRELIKGKSYRKISQKFLVSYHAVYRHKDHVPQALTKAQEAREVSQADNLLDQVKELHEKAKALLDKAENAGELRTALQGVREAKGCLELLGKLQGELQQEGTVNITLSPEWVELRAVILQVLDPYPEAKVKLAKAVQEVEEKNASNK